MRKKLPDVTLLLLRLWLGLNFAIAHGWGKVSNLETFVPKVEESFAAFPLPAAMAYFAAFGELLGGILIALGLLTRAASLALMGIMIGAAFVVHASDPWSRKEFALTYAVICLVLALRGAGQFSIDRLLFKKS